MQGQIKVSVCIATYNHQPFIAHCLDSALAQKTTFPVEILVGEDDSSDGTRDIVRDYETRYSDRLRVFYRDRKDVLYLDGQASGRRNLLNNLHHAQGDYVALLDGDDYWTDEYKLQKQVERLDADPSCVICFHGTYDLYEDGTLLPFPKPAQVGDRYGIETLLEANYIASVSVMFRNRLICEFPDWFLSVKYADWCLHILNARHGSIAYIKDVMAVHRVHGGGVWGGAAPAERIATDISVARTFRQVLNAPQRRIVDVTIANLRAELVVIAGRDEGIVRGLEVLRDTVMQSELGRRERGLFLVALAKRFGSYLFKRMRLRQESEKE